MKQPTALMQLVKGGMLLLITQAQRCFGLDLLAMKVTAAGLTVKYSFRSI
jgi:hypothetical protein